MGYLFYITILCVLLFSSFLNSRIFLKLAIFFCFLFTSSAMGFGYDWLNYRLVFDDYYVSSSGFVIVYEPAFSFILYIVSQLDLSFQWVIILSHLICFYFLYKYAVSFERSSFIFFCCYSFFGLILLNEQLRQAIALSIFLYSTTLKSRKCYWYLLLAMTFHYSAIFGLLFFGAKRFLSGKKSGFKLLVLCVMSYLFMLTFIYLLNSSILDVLLPPFISFKIQQYVNSGALGESGFSIGVLISLCLIFYFLIIRAGSSGSVYRSGAVFYAVFSIQSRMVFFLYRINYFFLPFVFCTFNSYFDKCLKERKYFNVFILTAVVFLYGMKPMMSPFFSQYLIDYEFYWISTVSFSQREALVCQKLLLIDPELDYCKRRF
ncbi:MAG: EpsG family protein [Shewanella sp.]